MTISNRKAADAFRERVYGSYVSEFKGASTVAELERSFERHAAFLDALLGPKLHPLPESALEVGCGPGAFLFWARRCGVADLAGIDVSREQTALAQSVGLPASMASFQEYLPEHRNEFDLVVAFDVIEHLQRDEGLELLDMAHAALKPGGRLVLSTPNGAALRPGPVWAGDLTHEVLYSPATIQHALRLSGFERIEVSEIAPLSLSVRSTIRRVLWAVLRLVPMLVDMVETGGAATRVYSRNMLVQARRPADG